MSFVAATALTGHGNRVKPLGERDEPYGAYASGDVNG
jgi:hypothetical protein